MDPRTKTLLKTGAWLLGALVVVGLIFQWTVNRVYVPVGKSLKLRYKGPLVFGERKMAKTGHYAEEGEIGVRKELRGPGRHFYCPIWWETELVDDLVVKPGEVAIVRSLLGEELPVGQYLVDGELGDTHFKGILRKAYGPGRYRVNPYAYEFTVVTSKPQIAEGQFKQYKHSGWVDIPTGFVGVVTNLADNPRIGAKQGIQDTVLPPGIYPINPKEQQVDIVAIGYQEISIKSELMRNKDGSLQTDLAGEPQLAANSGGITFPSKDGFPIHLDFTAVWGLMPSSAPEVIRTFGNVDAVENKVVRPQIESICRNHGSQYKAVELLIGDDRLKFQNETATSFDKVLLEKKLDLLYGLVRDIYIPREVREPIQKAFIADELKLTREQEQMTATEEAKLREAEQKVILEGEKVKAETEKLAAEAVAKGHKQVGETQAETTKRVAAIDKQVAELDAQAIVLQGEAKAQANKMKREAEAGKFQLAVDAFGTGENYNLWWFAHNLPDDIELQLFYAGEGTFWTDLRGMEALLGRQAQKDQKASTSKPSSPVEKNGTEKK